MSRADLIEASILVQKALSSPGFPVSEGEMRATAERRTDRAPFDPAGLARQSAALIAAPPRNALLKQVRAPALVLHGADDPVIPAAAARDTAESIPGAELVIVPGMGHDVGRALVPSVSSTSAILSPKRRRACADAAFVARPPQVISQTNRGAEELHPG